MTQTPPSILQQLKKEHPNISFLVSRFCQSGSFGSLEDQSNSRIFENATKHLLDKHSKSLPPF